MSVKVKLWLPVVWKWGLNASETKWPAVRRSELLLEYGVASVVDESCEWDVVHRMNKVYI